MTRGRYDNDIGFNRMIFVSLCFHVIALSIIFFAPSFPSPRWTFGPVHSVHLVSFSEVFQGEKSTSVLSREINETIPHDQTILKKSIHSRVSVPVQRMNVQRKQYSDIDRAVDDIRRKVASPGQSDRTDDTDYNAKINAYYTVIWSRIRGKWILPQGILPRDNIYAVIQARILKNGTVTELNFEKYSGNRYFDESAMKAIKKASPFPPLPGSIRENSIEVGIRFHSSEFR
ncbi:MAG: energy transducer TonB [Syntrophaceae bacterium]